MDDRWRDTFMAHSNLDVFRELVEKTKENIRSALMESTKPYVSFSGGKDSTCMLHLVINQCPRIMVHHWDYGRYMPRGYERETIEIARGLRVRNLRIETSTLYDENHNGPIWYNEFFNRIVPQYLREGFDLVFVGLRKQESIKRKLRIQAKRSLTEINESWPLADWTWLNIWAYILRHDLPYHSLYDRYGPVLGWDRVRFTTFFDPEFEKFGCSNIDGVLSWRERYPA